MSPPRDLVDSDPNLSFLLRLEGESGEPRVSWTQWMLSMGIDRMMVMGMVTVSMGVHGHRNPIGLASAGAFQFAEGAAFRETFDVVVMALLGLTHVLLKPQHLGSVFAERAVHRGVAADHVLDPFAECLHHLGVIAEIAGGDKLDRRVILSNPFGVLTDPTHQDAGKQEIWGHHNPTETQANDMAQAWLNQREGDTGVDGFTPAKAEALHQHPGHLGHIGIGVGV